MKNFQTWSQKTALWAIALLFFAAPISRALFSIGTGLLLLGWLFSAQWKNKWDLLNKSPATLAFVALLFWMLLSISWSPTDSEGIQLSLRSQYRLLLVPMVATLPLSSDWIKRYWYAFASGMIILLAHIFLLGIVPMPWISVFSSSGIFFSPLSQCIGMAIFAAWCLHELLNNHHSKTLRLFFTLAWFLATYALFFLSQQRSGYLTFFLGSITVLILKFSNYKKWITAVLFLLVGLAAISTNSTIQNRIKIAYTEFSNYSYTTDYTSVGARLHMWYISAKAIQKKPLTGHGLGSYPVISKQGFQDDHMCSIGCVHPHNYYIYIMLEYGAIGIILFLYVLIKMLHGTISKNKNAPLLMVVIAFIVASLTDTTLLYRGTMYLFAPFFGIIMAYPHIKDKKYE